MLSTFSVCLHHIHFMLYSFISEYCRDFQFVTALWIPKETQKLQMQQDVLTYSTTNKRFKRKSKTFCVFAVHPFHSLLMLFKVDSLVSM